MGEVVIISWYDSEWYIELDPYLQVLHRLSSAFETGTIWILEGDINAVLAPEMGARTVELYEWIQHSWLLLLKLVEDVVTNSLPFILK